MTRKIHFKGDRVVITLTEGMTLVVCQVLALSTYRKLFG